MIINHSTKEAYDLFQAGTLAFARAERQGIPVNIPYAEKQKKRLTDKIERLESRFMRTNFYKHWAHTTKRPPNINSNAQLAAFLYGVKKLTPVKTTDSGQGATDEESLSQLNIPEMKDLLEIRKLKKTRDTYLDAFLREQVRGVIHPSFNLHLVRTFRSSSDRPNFQNIPARDKSTMRIVRKALRARPGHQLFSADFSGLEVRIAACYHKDSTMLEYIRKDYDMHADMAKQVFCLDSFDSHNPYHKRLRYATKNGFVFPEFYGDYYKNCASSLAVHWGGLPPGRWEPGMGMDMGGGETLGDHMIEHGFKSLDRFEKYIQDIETDFWTNRFPEYARWKERWWRLYNKRGYIDLLTGFRCSGIMSRNDAINYPVQGSAFHCLLWSFNEIDRVMRKEKWRSRLIGQIHDEVMLDVHPEELTHVAQTVQRITCEELPRVWKWIIVPLEIEMDICPVDGSWADKEVFELK